MTKIQEFQAMTPEARADYLAKAHNDYPAATPEQIERINSWFKSQGIGATVRTMRADEAEATIAEMDA